MIRFSCPSCRKDLYAPEERAGTETQCPDCRQSVSIPPAGDVREHVQPTVPDSPPMNDPPVVLPAVDLLAPMYKLYSQGQIFLATFLGGPMAGFLLAAVNFRRLGRARAAWGMFALGTLVTVGVCILALVTPDGRTPSLLVALPGLLGTAGIVYLAQGSALSDHVRRGGRQASSWGAVGASVIGVVLILGGLFGWLLLFESEEPKVTFGPNEEIYYAEGASEAEARALSKALEEEGLFDGTGSVTVRLTRQRQGLTVEFVVQRNAWNDPATVKYYRSLRRKLMESPFAGQTIEVHLCDEELRRRKLIP